MQEPNLTYLLPLWGLLLATLAIVLISIEAGFRMGRYKSRRAPEKEAPLGTIVGAVLGLLAFLLAFSFGLASSRFDMRRQALLNEVNAIGTAYLRAQLLPEAEGAEVRDLLREYVEVRVEGVRSGRIEEAIRRSEALHGELWSRAVTAARKAPGSVAVMLFIQSLNDVIDYHTNRVTVGLQSGIPAVIWLVLYANMMLAMVLMGYNMGLNNRRRSLAVPLFALAFTVVLLLVIDLDHPRDGLIKVNQQAMDDLRVAMGP